MITSLACSSVMTSRAPRDSGVTSLNRIGASNAPASAVAATASLSEVSPARITVSVPCR